MFDIHRLAMGKEQTQTGKAVRNGDISQSIDILV